MKYARVLNGTILETRIFSEQPPVLAANKGAWLEVIEMPYPELTENQTADFSELEINGKWVQTWMIRNKTDLEKWEFPEFAKKITAPKELIFSTTGVMMKVWFDLNGLPVVLKGEQVNLYCNEILEEHSNILLEYQNHILIENKPEGQWITD